VALGAAADGASDVERGGFRRPAGKDEGAQRLKLGKVGFLAKYADYDATGFGVDTRKFWLQAEWAL
jgi:hypothetical protein